MRRAADIVGAENATVISDTSEFGHGSYLEPSKAHDVSHYWLLRLMFYADHGMKIFHIAAEDFFVSSAVIAPKDVPDVQAIVRLANEFEIPLWPFVSFTSQQSHTENWSVADLETLGRALVAMLDMVVLHRESLEGEKLSIGCIQYANGCEHSIGLDMGKNIGKVLEVNVDGAYCILEPGVTFIDLHNYLVKNNLRDQLWVDVPDLGGGSVIGNTVERGVGEQTLFSNGSSRNLTNC